MFFESPKNRARRLGALIAVFPAVACLAAIGCREPAADGNSPRDRRPRVVATTTVVGDLVRQVAGERVVVECLMRPGIDPHAYKATPRDADRLLRADLVVASGLHLEGRLAALLDQLADRVPVVAVADALPADRLLEADAGLPDPHAWFDAELWSRAAPVVAAALERIDPAGADHYRAGAEAYAARLRGLDARLKERIATIPADRRVLLTAHDAFRYFGRAYGIEVVGVQGTNTTSEAGLGDINRLVELVVSRGIPAVFVETSVADRNVTALVEGAAARGHRLVLGGRLYSDSLGERGSDGESLEAALEANVERIVAALGPEPAAVPEPTTP
jgi:manganese/zinc/iron transport system substrate-binding protein